MDGGSSRGGSSVFAQGGEPAVRKGPWMREEDLILTNYINAHGEGAWNNLARAAGLKRTGKSCRRRWLNYLNPNVRRGSITPAEHEVIVQLHARWGNRWSKISSHLPGRTDNEVKNYWRTKIQKEKKKQRKNLQADCSRATESTFKEGQGSSNSGRTQVTHQDCDPPKGYRVPGAGRGGSSGAGTMDLFPHPGIMSGRNFFWSLEDFWPMVQSFHSKDHAGRRI